MSWASQFIKHNRGFIGNAIKNISPALAFTPLGMLGAGAAGALGRAIQPGAKFGDIVKSGVSNAAIGGGARGGVDALRSAFAPSSSAAGSLAATPAGSAGSAGSAVGNGTLVSNGNGGWVSGAGQTGASGADAGEGFMSKLGSGAQAVGRFAKDNPNAIAGGLQGLGAIGSMGSENAMRRAQTNAINTNTAMTQQELDNQKKRQQALVPLLQALMGQQYAPAKNPYT